MTFEYIMLGGLAILLVAEGFRWWKYSDINDRLDAVENTQEADSVSFKIYENNREEHLDRIMKLEQIIKRHFKNLPESRSIIERVTDLENTPDRVQLAGIKKKVDKVLQQYETLKDRYEKHIRSNGKRLAGLDSFRDTTLNTLEHINSMLESGDRMTVEYDAKWQEKVEKQLSKLASEAPSQAWYDTLINRIVKLEGIIGDWKPGPGGLSQGQVDARIEDRISKLEAQREQQVQDEFNAIHNLVKHRNEEQK